MLAPFLSSFLDAAFVRWNGWGTDGYWQVWRLRFFSNVLAILTPVAAIAVMGSGALAWFGRISWLWFIGAIIGTVLVFGAPQIVAWIRSMFGV